MTIEHPHQLNALRGSTIKDIGFTTDGFAMVLRDPSGKESTIAIDRGIAGVTLGGVTVPAMVINKYRGRVPFEDLEYME